MKAEKSVGKSKEDYLEAIYLLIRKNGACRITDIANQLGFSKPSVSVAMNGLEADGYIVRDDWRILLTDEGREIAQRNYAKHAFFTNWLTRAGIDPETAQDEACRMEHDISYDSYEKIAAYLRAVDPTL